MSQKEQMKKMYKDELDRQVNIKKASKAYGNMSHAEKQLNKGELEAWKHYDATRKSLVPGQDHPHPKHI